MQLKWVLGKEKHQMMRYVYDDLIVLDLQEQFDYVKLLIKLLMADEEYFQDEIDELIEVKHIILDRMSSERMRKRAGKVKIPPSPIKEVSVETNPIGKDITNG